MNELSLSQVALAARCAGAAQDLFPGNLAPQISRERIAKILMHCKCNPGKSAARVVSRAELKVLATVLQVSPEWLASRNGTRDLVLWDPLADLNRPDQIIHLMNDHEDKATEVLIWADHLGSSLITPEFMHKHNEASFTELDILGKHEEKRKLVQVYDHIGNARRKRLLDSEPRGRRLVQLIFVSDILRMVQGELEYSNIRKHLRKVCLRHVKRVLSDLSPAVELLIVKDDDTDNLKPAFRDYDWIGVFGESLVLWRHHSGRIAWSEHPEITDSYRRLLKVLEGRATIHRRTEVLEFLDRLDESII
jgi:hypothetical protein